MGDLRARTLPKLNRTERGYCVLSPGGSLAIGYIEHGPNMHGWGWTVGLGWHTGLPSVGAALDAVLTFTARPSSVGEHYEPFAQPVAQPVAQTADLTTRLLAALDAEQRGTEAVTLDSGVYMVWEHKHVTLRRIAALRRIVERHTDDGYGCCREHGYDSWDEARAEFPCPDLLDIAAALGVEP